MIKSWNLLLAIFSIFLVSPSAVMLAKNFDAVEQYMRKSYIRGWHNSNYYPPTHEVFVRDFETNQLFNEFKVALESGNAEAKRVFEVVLRDLCECLSFEREYGPRTKNQIRALFIGLGALSLLGAIFSPNETDKEQGVAGFILCAAVVGFSYLPSGPKTSEDSKKGKYGRVIDDLEKRIEFWLQLLSGDNFGSVVTLESK